MLCVLLMLWLCSPLFAAVKPQYGGTLKVATDLLADLDNPALFEPTDVAVTPFFPLPFTRTETSVTIDFSGVDPTLQLEIEQSVEKMQDAGDPCHWVLDYPYFNHQHPNSVAFQNGKLTVQSSEPDFLRVITTASCLVPNDLHFLQSFHHTQFAYESNPTCIGGRPFVNSIIPVSVDPTNPYLYFKLGDADVIPVSEERFASISKDPDATIFPGPRFYIYLKTSNLTGDQARQLADVLNLNETASAVLNNHSRLLYSTDGEQAPSRLKDLDVHLTIPREDPYRLIGERIAIQWTQAGIHVQRDPSPAGTPTVELAAAPIQDGSMELFQYQLLKGQNPDNTDQPWFDIWDELEASGKIIPLFLYTSNIAVRNNIHGLRIRSDGLPDFSNCWIQMP